MFTTMLLDPQTCDFYKSGINVKVNTSAFQWYATLYIQGADNWNYRWFKKVSELFLRNLFCLLFLNLKQLVPLRKCSFNYSHDSRVSVCVKNMLPCDVGRLFGDLCQHSLIKFEISFGVVSLMVFLASVLMSSGLLLSVHTHLPMCAGVASEVG